MLCSCATDTSAPILRVEGGKIQGVRDTTGKVLVYKGIPYAAPPVGSLRWVEPQPVVAWNDTLLCDKFGDACVQNLFTSDNFYYKEFYDGPAPEMSEDCLYLNVYAPSGKNVGGWPVAVWIHGGSFDHGYGHENEFDGEALARKGVILVTINYRLGVFGYMALPELAAESKNHTTGNYGLLDQYAALKWVKKNISAFGGDPRRITVMGQSAGAGSVQALVSSKMCKDLLYGAVIQSGGGLRGIIPTQSMEEKEVYGSDFFKYCGFGTVSQGRNTSAEILQGLYNSYLAEDRRMFFGPCVDGYMLKANTNSIALSNNELDINYMIGYCADDIAPDVMKTAAVQWSLLLEKQDRDPAYVYCFSRRLPGDDAGAFHSSELRYEFGTLGRSWRPFTEADYALSDRMTGCIANFCRNGDPNGDKNDGWEPYTDDVRHIEIFDIK